MNDWPADPKLDDKLQRLADDELATARQDARTERVHVGARIGQAGSGGRARLAGISLLAALLIVVAVAVRGVGPAATGDDASGDPTVAAVEPSADQSASIEASGSGEPSNSGEPSAGLSHSSEPSNGPTGDASQSPAPSASDSSPLPSASAATPAPSWVKGWVRGGGGPTSIRLAVKLIDDRILIVEEKGAQIYSPFTHKYTAVGSATTSYPDGSATLLADGRVLLAGGMGGGEPIQNRSDAVLFDPSTNKFTATGSMSEGRWGYTATLLANGRVLIAGGGVEHCCGLGDVRSVLPSPRHPIGNATMSMSATAEIYDPVTGQFTPTGSMTTGRDNASAVRLANGRVLIMGGGDEGNAPLASAELYDPATGGFTAAGSMLAPRYRFAALLLPSGRVLVVGGQADSGAETRLEIYDPATHRSALAGSAPGWTRAAALPNGQALLIGNSCLVYDPATKKSRPAPSSPITGDAVNATVSLSDGRVVIFSQSGVLIYQP
jgi:hypothetical protein